MLLVSTSFIINTSVFPHRPKKLNPLGSDSQIRANSQTLSLSLQTFFSSLTSLIEPDLTLSTSPSQTHTLDGGA